MVDDMKSVDGIFQRDHCGKVASSKLITWKKGGPGLSKLERTPLNPPLYVSPELRSTDMHACIRNNAFEALF